MVVALAVGAVVVAVAALGASGDPVDAEARAHAQVACDMTARADEATEVSTRSRMAAAVLLLDQAIVASERAATTDPAFADLDAAVQEVHAAGHRGEPEEWAAAMSEALSNCASAQTS